MAATSTGGVSSLASVPGVVDAEAWMSDEEKELMGILMASGQEHLFAAWEPGQDEDKKHAFFDQVKMLQKSYPGGVAAYVSNAKALLAASKEGANPFEGFTPEVPAGETLDVGSPEFITFEEEGLKLVRDCAFCLVAGGLGERLGYSGIKVSLPVEVTTKRTYLEVYAQHILGLQAASNALAGGEPKAIPLAIMTSDDTHARTEALLAANDNFGFAPGQVVLMKQEKVPSLMDNAARIALGEDGFSMQTKPHGHGDVHSLLHSTGLAQKWAEEGRRYVVFFQDTNALAFLVTLATIGVSANRGFQVNSVTVPRKAKDAMGAIARLVRSDGSAITCNVEYNQLEPLLLASGHAEGDANDASGFSPFPGNINQLVLSISEYAAVLKATGGAMPEFVNPKYADAEKTKFKKPTRLECMMQDYPKLLEPTAKVGFTTFAEWTFCPVKNATADAQKIAGKGVPMRCASEGEMTYYSLGQRILQAAGCGVPASGTLEVTGLTLPHPPHIVLYPSFMSTWQGALQRLSGGPAIEVAPGSTLVLDGPDISIQSLKLNGSLTIRAVPGAVVCVKDAVVANAGHELQPLEEDSTAPESLKIRGFDIVPTEEAVIVASAPGTFTVSGAVSTGVTTLS